MQPCWALVLLASPAQAQTGNAGYRVGVVSESGDIVTWLKPEGTGLTVDRVVPIGIMPSDIDGPHNITVSPDGRATTSPSRTARRLARCGRWMLPVTR